MVHFWNQIGLNSDLSIDPSHPLQVRNHFYSNHVPRLHVEYCTQHHSIEPPKSNITPEEALKREAIAKKEAEEALKREAEAKKASEETLKREAAAKKEKEEALKREAAAKKESEEALKREAAAKKEAEEALKKAEAAKKEKEDFIQRQAKVKLHILFIFYSFVSTTESRRIQIAHIQTT
jgi:hypothetical protein